MKKLYYLSIYFLLCFCFSAFAQIDAGVEELISPKNAQRFGETPISISIKNYGVDTLKSVDVYWQIDSDSVKKVSYAPNLVAEDTVTKVLGIYDFSLGNHQVKIWTANPNGTPDTINSNDTVLITAKFQLGDTMTIGGVDPDFLSFKSAVDTINKYASEFGEKVVFMVRDGVYEESFELRDYMTILFQSESDNDPGVTLKINEGAGISFNSSTVRFKNIDLIGGKISFGNRINWDFSFGYWDGCEISSEITCNDGKFSFENCLLLEFKISNWLFGDMEDTDFIFKNNTVYNGTINLSGSVSFGHDISNLSIVNNKFFNSIINAHSANLIFQENRSENLNIRSSGDNSVDIFNNIIVNRDSVVAISMEQPDPRGSGGGIIYNNFFVSKNATAIRVAISEFFRLKIFNNNIKLVGDSTNAPGIFIRASTQPNSSDFWFSQIDVKNNIIENQMFGPVLSYYNVNNVDKIYSNNNDLVSNGEIIARANNINYADLQEWYLGTSYGANSLSVDPLFVSDTDLHVQQPLLNGAGIPVPGVTVDIDGEPRDPVHPDIGADEFDVAGTIDIGLVDLVYPISSCEGDTNVKVQVSIKNYGTVAASGFDVGFLMSDSIGLVENVNGWSLEPGSTATYTFQIGVDLSESGVYKFLIGVRLIGDSNQTNDSINRSIEVYETPNLRVSGDTSICEGDSVILWASGANTYLWSTGSTDSVIGAKPSVTTTYKVEGVSVNGCITSKEIIVTVNSAYKSEIDTVICDGDSIFAGGAYQKETGTYWDSLSTVFGCDSLIITNLLVHDGPVVRLDPFTTDTVCLNKGITLPLPLGTPVGGVYTGNGVVGGVFNVDSAGAGLHILYYTYTDSNSCSGMDSTQIYADLCLGVDALAKDKFKVTFVPNPAKNYAAIHYQIIDATNVSIELYDLKGNLVKKVVNEFHDDGKYQVNIDLNSLGDGVFLLKSSTQKLVEIQRVVILK